MAPRVEAAAAREAERRPRESLAAQRVATARRCIEALNARDFDAYFACMTPDFVIATPAGLPGGSVEIERRNLRRFFDDFFRDWQDVRYEFVEGPEPVGQRLLSRDRWVGRPRDGAGDGFLEFFSVASFRGSLAARVDMFTGRDAAYDFARTGRRVREVER